MAPAAEWVNQMEVANLTLLSFEDTNLRLQILSSLKKFHRLNQSIWRFSSETSLLVSTFYYTILLGLDASVLIIVDSKTDHLIRVTAIAVSLAVFAFSITGIGLFTSVSLFSNNITVPLERFLFRGQQVRPSTQLKLVELRCQLTGRLIGIGPKGVFIFTPQKVSQILFNLMVNFFLVFNLFRTYFF